MVDVAAVGASISLWYLTSFGTLLLNKYLMGYLHVQPNTLAAVQMVSTAIYGALKTLKLGDVLRLAREARSLVSQKNGARKAVADPESPDTSDHLDGLGNKGRRWRRSLIQMSFVGLMRFSTVVLGLVSLKYVAASFTETIKASAPFFTVIVAYLMLGERTGVPVLASLVPVAGGLVLVSSTELSYNIVGFGAAVLTNIIECVQNVFSKRLLANEYTASQLQFYTSLTALVMQAPIFLITHEPAASHSHHVEHDISHIGLGNKTLALTVSRDEIIQESWTDSLPDRNLLLLLWIDGVLYHVQSVIAYVVMSYLSPVTVSVVNTLKRALIICISLRKSSDSADQAWHLHLSMRRALLQLGKAARSEVVNTVHSGGGRRDSGRWPHVRPQGLNVSGAFTHVNWARQVRRFKDVKPSSFASPIRLHMRCKMIEALFLADAAPGVLVSLLTQTSGLSYITNCEEYLVSLFFAQNASSCQSLPDPGLTEGLCALSCFARVPIMGSGDAYPTLPPSTTTETPLRSSSQVQGWIGHGISTAVASLLMATVAARADPGFSYNYSKLQYPYGCHSTARSRADCCWLNNFVNSTFPRAVLPADQQSLRSLVRPFSTRAVHLEAALDDLRPLAFAPDGRLTYSRIRTSSGKQMAGTFEECKAQNGKQ
ncbi:Solute carrier family 35 member E2B [Symbiodinium microadriaticum]|uniref:Solute carrier family 35 member E2B n=1 Tax=Symbiodinium microadriaticum TaxID=2951 RepID=A0A1Q9DEX1_SYMMI|nr:Solute carrier family 35 member E2B [Symbiodinium microadriaticum]